MTEDQLVSGCRAGDQVAQRTLYDQTSERIYRLLLRLTRDHEDARDLAQSVYLRVFERIRQFDGQSQLATWVYRIALNEALQHLRRRKMHLAHRAGLAHAAASKPRANGLADVEIRDALDSLPADDRAVVLLRHMEGLSYAEIADLLGWPAGTVASRLNRARTRLRELMEAPATPVPGRKRPAGESDVVGRPAGVDPAEGVS